MNYYQMKIKEYGVRWGILTASLIAVLVLLKNMPFLGHFWHSILSIWFMFVYGVICGYWLRSMRKPKSITIADAERELLRITLLEIAQMTRTAEKSESTVTYKETIDRIALVLNDKDIQILIRMGLKQ